MERRINRRRQGDLGEASAIEWFTRAGAIVSVPFGHSPDYDLIAEIDGRLLRVQVKTSVCRSRTPNGHLRYEVSIATLGGNQSWSGRVKTFDPERVDALFVLTGNGRRWLIPAMEVESATALHLGGPKYEEFEIDGALGIEQIVYGPDPQLVRSDAARGSAGAWRAGPACKVGALALSEFESHLPHSAPDQAGNGQVDHLPSVVRGTAPRGQTRVSGHRQIVIPKRAFEAAELALGDRLKAFATGPGEVTFRRIAREQNANGPP